MQEIDEELIEELEEKFSYRLINKIMNDQNIDIEDKNTIANNLLQLTKNFSEETFNGIINNKYINIDNKIELVKGIFNFNNNEETIEIIINKMEEANLCDCNFCKFCLFFGIKLNKEITEKIISKIIDEPMSQVNCCILKKIKNNPYLQENKDLDIKFLNKMLEYLNYPYFGPSSDFISQEVIAGNRSLSQDNINTLVSNLTKDNRLLDFSVNNFLEEKYPKFFQNYKKEHPVVAEIKNYSKEGFDKIISSPNINNEEKLKTIYNFLNKDNAKEIFNIIIENGLDINEFYKIYANKNLFKEFSEEASFDKTIIKNFLEKEINYLLNFKGNRYQNNYAYVNIFINCINKIVFLSKSYDNSPEFNQNINSRIIDTITNNTNVNSEKYIVILNNTPIKFSQQDINATTDKLIENNYSLLQITKIVSERYPEFFNNYVNEHPNLEREIIERERERIERIERERIEREREQNNIYSNQVNHATSLSNLFTTILGYIYNNKGMDKIFDSMKNIDIIISENKSQEEKQNALDTLKYNIDMLDNNGLHDLKDYFDNIPNLESKMNQLSQGMSIGGVVRSQVRDAILFNADIRETLNNTRNNSFSKK